MASPTSCTFCADDAASGLPKGWQPPESHASCNFSAGKNITKSLTKSFVFFATYDDTKGSTFICLGRDRLRAPYRHLRMSERYPYDAHTRLYISQGLREATTRTSLGVRTVIVEIVRASCDFSEAKISQNRKATVLPPYGNRLVSVWRPYNAAYDGFTRYNAYSKL